MKVLEENIVGNFLNRGLGNDFLNLKQSKISRNKTNKWDCIKLKNNNNKTGKLTN